MLSAIHLQSGFGLEDRIALVALGVMQRAGEIRMFDEEIIDEQLPADFDWVQCRRMLKKGTRRIARFFDR